VTSAISEGRVTLRLEGASNVDFWAVDWDHDGQVFRPAFHAARAKKSGELMLEGSHAYAAPGARRVAVQLVDSAGVEMRRLIEVG